MKTILVLIIIVSYNIVILAQTPQSNLEKYWFYRQRFNQYFIIPCKTDECLERGEGMIITNRNSYSDDLISFSQPKIMAGFYLGVLATEYKLLKNYNQHSEASKTLNDIKKALNTYIRTDKIESEEPWIHYNSSSEDKFDGFFLRNDLRYNSNYKKQDDMAFLMDKKYNINNSLYFRNPPKINLREDPLYKNSDVVPYVKKVGKGYPGYIDPGKLDYIPGVNFSYLKPYFLNSNIELYTTDEGGLYRLLPNGIHKNPRFDNDFWVSEKNEEPYTIPITGPECIDWWEDETFNSNDEVIGILLGGKAGQIDHLILNQTDHLWPI